MVCAVFYKMRIDLQLPHLPRVLAAEKWEMPTATGLNGCSSHLALPGCCLSGSGIKKGTQANSKKVALK